MGEAQQQGAAPCRRERNRLRIAQEFGGISICNDQAAVLRQQAGVEPDGNAEVEPVAPGPILRPFAVRPQVRHRSLDLGDQYLAITGNRHHIRTPTVRQTEFPERGVAAVNQCPAQTARQQSGGVECNCLGGRDVVHGRRRLP